MARINRDYADPRGVHTQRLESNTGTQANASDFYAVNRTFAENGQINLDPLVRGLSAASGAIQDKVMADAKIWSYNESMQGEMNFKKRLAEGADPASLEKEFLAWQSKTANSAPSGVARNQFMASTNDMGRSMLLAGIRQAAAIRTKDQLEKIDAGINNEAPKIIESYGAQSVKLGDVEASLKSGILGIAEEAQSKGVLPKAAHHSIEVQSEKIYKEIAFAYPDQFLADIDQIKGKISLSKFEALKKLAINASVDKSMTAAPSYQEMSAIKQRIESSNMLPIEKAQAMERYNQLAATNHKNIQADPYSYISKSMEFNDVYSNRDAAYMALSQNPKDPLAQENYNKANSLYFESIHQQMDVLGVPRSKQVVVGKDQAERDMARINEAAIGSEDQMHAVLNDLKTKNGSYLGEYLNGLLKHAPAESARVPIALGLIGKNELSSFLKFNALMADKTYKPGGKLSSDEKKSINDQVLKDFMPYYNSLVAADPMNAKLADSMIEQFQQYALYKGTSKGIISNTVGASFDTTIIGEQPVSIPKSNHTPTDMSIIKDNLKKELFEYTSVYKASLESADYNTWEKAGKVIGEQTLGKDYREYKDLTNANPFRLSDEQKARRQELIKVLPDKMQKAFEKSNELNKKAYWATLPDESGVQLMSIGDNGLPYAVDEANGGIVRYFKDLKHVK